MTTSRVLRTWLVSAMLLVLTVLCPPARAQACDVAEGQTLINTGVRLCEGGQVRGQLFNRLGAAITSLGMTIGGGPLGPGEVLTEGAFISREPDFFNWSKVTIGPGGSFDQRFILHSFGAFTNHGEFRNIGLATFGGGSDGRGVLHNTGMLHNAGTLDFTSNLYFYFGNANGSSITFLPGDNASLVNAGEILNDFSGSLLLDNVYGSLDFTGGRLINRGYLRMRGNNLQMGDARSGTLELLAQGTADLDTLVVDAGYRQLNAGLLLIGQRLQVAGTLQNDGTITVRGLVDIDSREYPGQSMLINNGHLQIDDQVGNTPFGARLHIDHQGSLENNGSLQIEASSTFSNRGSYFVNKGDLINRGQITNAGGYFELTGNGRFTLDGHMENIEVGRVIFAAGSITTGTGHYRQSAGSTQLDGRVEIAAFEITGGSLCGSGILNGSLLMSGGMLCPGNSPGRLHIVGDVALLGGTLQLEIAGTAAGLYDVLQVDGALSFAAGVVLDVAFIGGYVPQAGDSWPMLSVGGTTTGLAGLELRLSGLPAGYTLARDDSGAFTLELAAVPEPGSALLMLVGLCGLIGVALRRQAGLAALAVGGLCGLGALPAQACADIDRVVPIAIDLRSRIYAGETYVNTNPLGCHDFLPLVIEAGGTLNNHAGLLNALGEFNGPNGRGGLFVNGLLDNKVGATINNLGEFYVDFRFVPAVGTVINSGSFTNQGLFDQWGMFTTGSLGSFHHQSGSFISGGQFKSAGNFDNRASASIVSGSFSNSGVMTNRASFAVSGVGTHFANAGVIDNLAGAALTIDAFLGSHDFSGGTLNNAGLFSNSSGLQLGSSGGGTVNMLAGSLIEGTSIRILEGHIQMNAGRLRMNDSLAVLGSLHNDGVLDIQTEYAAVGYTGAAGLASLVNNKTLNIGGNDGSTFYSATLTNDASLLNNGHLRIEVSGRLVNGVADVNFGQINGHFQNNGQVANLGSLRNSATLDSGGAIYNDSLFLNSGKFNNTGLFDNRGEFSSGGELLNQGSIVNSGSFEVSGPFTQLGTFENSGTVLFAAGSVTQGTGSYTQSAGLSRLDGVVDIADFALQGGRLCGSGRLNGNLLVNGGDVCPGNSAGTLEIGGDLDFFSGTIRLEIAGNAAGQHDLLEVDGYASFQAGQIEVVFIDGYLPQPGEHWTLLSFPYEVFGLSNLTLQVTGLPDRYTFTWNANGEFGVGLAPVPEPSHAALLLVGLAALWERIAIATSAGRRVSAVS